ncbi:MAG: hypothetical protein GTN76_07875 [Candidatus Aenigmarchaeota archaeon]|nr:hypothetical protein [Candidatus Aenigmarchaeota archaeon]
MAEISNNLLAGLLIVAIVVSIVGLANTITLIPVLQYTGFATSGTGKSNVTITSEVSITLIRNETLFGSGYTNTATIHRIYSNESNQWGDRNNAGFFNNGSEGNNTEGNCTYGKSGNDDSGNCADPFVIENDGNDESTCIKLYAAATPQSWIGGSAQTPEFKMSGEQNESTWGSTTCAGTGYPDSCVGTLTEEWTDVGTSATTICTQLNASQCTDEMRVHFMLGLPSDTSEGGKQTTVTVEGSNNC